MKRPSKSFAVLALLILGCGALIAGALITDSTRPAVAKATEPTPPEIAVPVEAKADEAPRPASEEAAKAAAEIILAPKPDDKPAAEQAPPVRELPKVEPEPKPDIKPPARLPKPGKGEPKETRIAQVDPDEKPAKAESKPRLVQLPAVPKLTIKGPDVGPRGPLHVFEAVIEGDFDGFQWSVSPEMEGCLQPLADPRKCVFGCSEPGLYSICLIAVRGGRIVKKEHDFEMLGDDGSQPQVRAVPAQQLQPPVPQQTVQESIITELNRVQSPALLAEARIVGPCFRTTATRIESGQFPPGADVMADVSDQVRRALGTPETVGRWVPFMRWANTEVSVRRDHGISPSGFLHEVANACATVEPKK